MLPNLLCCRDLGIILNNRLTFYDHVSSITKKAYAIANLMFPCFDVSELKWLVLAYKCFIRPLLEHSTIISSPMLRCRGNMGLNARIEKVQRYCTRIICKRCHLHCNNYKERLTACGLETLELRRLKNDLVFVYKMLNSMVDCKFEDYFKLANSRTRGHSLKLIGQLRHSNCASNVFSQSQSHVQPWNSLPKDVISATSISMFKRNLNKVDLCQFMH